MLDAAGVGFRAEKPGIDENAVKDRSTNPAEIAGELAAAKACSISSTGWVIGSDSVVSVRGDLFDKPRNREQATEHLRLFSGKPMRLTSAVALAHNGEIDWHFTDAATLIVRTLSDAFINHYLDAEWPDVGHCVGVFRMEGRGVQLFERVEGDYFTILGMPLVPLLGALRERGLMPA